MLPKQENLSKSQRIIPLDNFVPSGVLIRLGNFRGELKGKVTGMVVAAYAMVF